MPLRPVPLRECGVRLERCRCSAVEHTSDIYRLYEYDSDTGGVFRDGQIVCQSIPKADENPRCVGLLIFRKDEFAKELRHYKEYWHWRTHRNEARWTLQESGETDYDAKSMMHTLRLLLSAESIFTVGRPLVRLEGDLRDYLLRVRHGEFSYDTLMADVEARIVRVRELAERSRLPESVDSERVNELVLGITRDWENNH